MLPEIDEDWRNPLHDWNTALRSSSVGVPVGTADVPSGSCVGAALPFAVLLIRPLCRHVECGTETDADIPRRGLVSSKVTSSLLDALSDGFAWLPSVSEFWLFAAQV